MSSTSRSIWGWLRVHTGERNKYVNAAATFYNSVEDRADYVVSQAKNLPASQPVAFKLLNMFNSKNYNSADLINLIKYDANLTACILKLSNSALYRRTSSVDTLDQAVMRLGDSAIIGIITTNTMKEISQAGASPYIPQNQLWRHSVFASISARHVAKIRIGLNIDHDIAFTTGLLHDIGKVVINASNPDEVGKIRAVAEEGNVTVLDAERKVLGADHALIGSRLLGKWGVDKNICSAIQKHHSQYEEDSLAAICIIANFLARKAEGRTEEGEVPDRRLMNSIDLDEDILFSLLDKILSEGEKTLQAYE